MKNIFLTIIGSTILLSGYAQIDRSVRPGPGFAPHIELGEAKTFVLDNGLKVFVVENRKVPSITFSMVFDYDPVFEGPAAGMVDMTGQLLRTATANRTKKQIDEEIDFIGASLNASATDIYASGLSRYAPALTELLADIIINARFEKEHFDRIKTQTLSGLAASKNNPTAIASRVNNVLLYGERHPYGVNVTEKSLENITIDMCSKFFETFYKPNITYMAIVGDIKFDEAKKLVEKHFGYWKAGEIPSMSYPAPKPPLGTRVAIVDRPNAVQSTINVSFPAELKPGSEDAIAARVMNSILGGSTSRLFNNLREKHGFTYGAYSRLTSDKLIGSFVASTDVRNIATDSAVREILYEIKRIRQEIVPADELRLYKNEINGNFALSLENPQTVANFSLNIARYKLPADYYNTYLQRLAAINEKHINGAANTYLFPDNANILIVGKASEVSETMKEFASDGRIHYYDEDGKEYDPANRLKAAPQGITAKHVTQKYIQAIGGEKKLSKTKDITINAVTSMQGMTITYDTYRKAPNKIKVEIGSGGTVFSKKVFDGTNGMVFSQMGNQPLNGDMLEEMRIQAILNPELDYQKHGIKQELLGIEMVDGKEAYKMNITLPHGKTITNYYNAESGLLIRSITESGNTDFSDYRDVNGLKFPFAIKQAMGSQTIDLKVISVKINSKLKDNLFSMPATHQ
ncbi:MAG: insulinase family protein [Bacteroidales bacterium]|nr:insulinase family protein [Bacteroidales bacterium]MDZ4204178.1 insulinase family protein [Bacteroidales bacterium]